MASVAEMDIMEATDSKKKTRQKFEAEGGRARPTCREQMPLTACSLFRTRASRRCRRENELGPGGRAGAGVTS